MVFEVVMRNVTDMTGVDIQRGEEHSQIIDMLKMRLLVHSELVEINHMLIIWNSIWQGTVQLRSGLYMGKWASNKN
jgi:hypothetical protein